MGESNYSALKESMERTSPELAYAENISARLKKRNLIPAVMIQSVSESDLYTLNRLNDDTPFRDEFSDKKIEVPVRYSVCEMQLTYGMKKAVAYFEKEFGENKCQSRFPGTATVPQWKGECGRNEKG